MKFLVSLLFILFFQIELYAQNLFWVYLIEKETPQTLSIPVSYQTIQNRLNQQLPLIQKSDFPPSSHCLTVLKNKNIQIRVISKWLNAVSAQLTSEDIIELKKCACVKEIIPINTYSVPSGNFQQQQDIALQQMKGEMLKDKNIDGEGFTIGVIDAGFWGADTLTSLQNIFQQKRIRLTRDFLNPNPAKNFYGSETFLDDHGTYVLNCIAGETSEYQYGLSTESQFILARTDHGINESRREEDLWIAAIEWMDSLGVKLVNTSLGYTTDFDDPNEDYKTNQITGNYSAIAKAAQIASTEKGILIVVSAGNEGAEKKWEILATPADAQGVLTVGANTLQGIKQEYSSIGPEKLPWLKPEVVAYSEDGTSFSAPLITGLAASLWAEYPTLTNTQLKNVIIQSAHLYPFGNNFLGYGIPQADRALELIENQGNNPKEIIRITAKKKKVILPIKNPNLTIALFHTKGNNIVVKQEIITNSGKELIIIRPGICSHSTVAFGTQETIQIQWK